VFTPSDGASLQLNASASEWFEDAPERPLSAFAAAYESDLDIPIVLGLTSDGKQVTLEDCWEAGRHLSIPGYPTSRLLAKSAFVGAHFSVPQEILFRRFVIAYAHLDEWTNVKLGISPKRVKDGDAEVKLNWVPREEVARASIGEGQLVSIFFLVNHSSGQNEFRITRHAYCRFEFSEALSVESFKRIASVFQTMMSLGVQRPVYPLSIEGRLSASRQNLPDKIGPDGAVKIYLPSRMPREEPPRRHPSKMLFTLWHLRDKFQRTMKDWFDKADRLKPVYELYYSVISDSHAYTEDRFLNIIQALEVWHKRGRLKGNEDRPCLKARLRAILEDCKPALSTNAFQQYSELLAKAVGTRNFLTHFKPTREERAAKGLELYELTEKMRALLECCLLLELGLDVRTIKGMLERQKATRRH